MKKNCLLFALTGLIFCSLNLKSFAQDKSVDFDLGKNGIMYNITPCGDDNFYVVYGKMLLSKNAQKNLMKFDKDLKEVWAKPIVFTGASVGDINIFSYTKPSDKTTIGYIFGGEQFIQVSPDGTSKEKKTEIPEKELENVAAIFADSIGLNIITLTGEKDFLTGKMKWYTFTHDQLTRKEKTITLAKPADIDDKNESGWRLSCVAPTGLYFYYVSYKNDTKETTRPILACNIVKVDYTGKSGSIINIDLKDDKYNIIPSFYYTNFLNLSVIQPVEFNSASHTGSAGGGYTTYSPTDISYLGVVIDEKSNRIYTCYATNNELKVGNNGEPKFESLGKGYMIKNLNFNVYDLSGSSINQSKINFIATPLEARDECSYAGNKIDLYLLQANQGLICKVVNNYNGYIYALDNKGAQIEEKKIEIFTYKMLMQKFVAEKFAANYSSLKDFESSVYFLGTTKSSVYQYFNKLDEKKKRYVSYLSLKSEDLLLLWDGKEDKVKLTSFNKK